MLKLGLLFVAVSACAVDTPEEVAPEEEVATEDTPPVGEDAVVLNGGARSCKLYYAQRVGIGLPISYWTCAYGYCGTMYAYDWDYAINLARYRGSLCN